MKEVINLFYRKRNENAFSIEGIFNTLIDHIDEKNLSIKLEKVEVKEYSSNLFKVLINSIYVYKNRRNINHIVGDIHYAVLSVFFKKSILTIHDCVMLEKNTGVKYLIFKYLWYVYPIRMADVVTVISEKTKSDLSSIMNIPSRKLIVIPNFYNPIFKRQKKYFNTENPTILQVGTKENKNLNRLILALRNIKCNLEIIGKLSENQLCLLEKSKINYINYYRLTTEDIYKRYINCDILAFISTYEGFGMPIIEAQAVGRAVLTSNIEPMISVAGSGALFVNPNSILEITKGIRKIIEDKKAREKIVNQGYVNSYRFSIEKIAKRYISLYKELANDEL